MKKIITLLLAFSFIFANFGICFAKTSAATAKTAASASSKTVISKIREIKFTKSGSQDKITISTPIYKGYKISYLPSPDRLIIDIPNNVLSDALTKKSQKGMKISGKYISSIRFSQFTKNSVRVVLDISGKAQYSAAAKTGQLTVAITKVISSGKTTTKTDSSSISRGDLDRTPVDHNTGTPTPTPTPTATPTPVPVPTATPAPLPTDDSSSSVTPGDSVITPAPAVVTPIPQMPVISMANGKIEYYNINGKASIKLKGITIGNIAIGSSAIGTADTSAVGTTTAGAADTSTTTAPTAPTILDFKSAAVPSYDETGTKFMLSFPVSLLALEPGITQINDGILLSLETGLDSTGQNSFIIFTTANKYYFDIKNGNTADQANITLFRQYSLSDKLVVLDAGHGGSDPGASYAGVLEKDLNLKITLKVDEILRSRGILTYLTRSDDTFVPLYDRANTANYMNAALFLSVHNNAYNTSENGTETLYYPKDKSRQFAQTLQDTLINALGTKNRGIVERPNLVVLHATKMTSSLAEIAFITNSGDRAKLLDDAFIQKAAQALSDAVIFHLSTMN